MVFKNGNTTLGTATLNSGKATFTTSGLAAGSQSIIAVYGGDANFTGTTSSVFVQTVRPDSTSTALASSVNPSRSGQSVTFTATVTANAPGSGIPSGQVTFKDGGTVLGTAQLNGSGRATFSISSLSSGKHSITAVYAGSSSFQGGTSGVFIQTVNSGHGGGALVASTAVGDRGRVGLDYPDDEPSFATVRSAAENPSRRDLLPDAGAIAPGPHAQVNERFRVVVHGGRVDRALVATEELDQFFGSLFETFAFEQD